MAILSSKWFIAALILFLVLLLLLIVGRKSVQTEITIGVSADEVWSVLTDTPNVKQWNKVLVPIEGELKEGSTVKYEFYQEEGGKAAVMDAKVKKIVSNELINQAGGIPGVLTFDHQYIIESDPSGVTKVRIHEKYRGIMVPFWNPAPVELAYARLLSQLKQRLEDA